MDQFNFAKCQEKKKGKHQVCNLFLYIKYVQN